MSGEQSVHDLSFPVKVYVGLVHLLLLFLVVLFLQRPFRRKNGDKGSLQGRKSRTFIKDNRAVTIESCEWINSTLAWFYLHAQNNEGKDRTPNIVKIWLRALNKQLQKDKKKDQKIVIESLSPGCLPPKLTSVYCLCVSGNMQCITFHVESTDLGFLVRVINQTDNGPKSTLLETRVVKLTGEVALQLSTAPSKLEISVQFIGVPEIVMSTKCLAKESEVDGTEVQEKVKEVICKTITSIPLTDATSRERLSSDASSVLEQSFKFLEAEMKSSCVQIENNYYVNVHVYVFMNERRRAKSSSTSKERLNSPSSISCAGEEGKLLVKVIKASGLCGKGKTGPISPYCIVSTSNPLQRKRTSMVRDNDSPFWNEYFTFDITPKTKEITLDIYDYEKSEKDSNGHMDDDELTEEQDDYLGQVIVPLSTVNRDQTCRLILPVLPRSSKSEHSKGDISLEFTFDKDGKVIDATLPLISGLERKVPSSEPERPSAHSTPSEESPSVLMNGVESGIVNGHVPLRKRYVESSLDELAMEIEAYEQGENGPKPASYHGDVQAAESYKEPELHGEPATPPVVIATPAPEPLPETKQKEEEDELAIAELLKTSEGEELEESKEEKIETEGEVTEKEVEKEEEEKEQKGKDDEEHRAQEQEEKTEELSIKPKHRRSFNLFKRRKADKKTEKEEEKIEETAAPEDETRKGENIEEIPVEDKEESKETEAEDEKEKDKDVQEDNEQKEKEEEEKEEQASKLDTKPKLRRSFNLFRRRPQSMAATDRKLDEDNEERVMSRHDPVRHSYHAGDLPEPSNLRKSTSQSSLLSYSPNPYSTLVVETVSKGQKKYSHIPPVMAKRRAYEKGGNKLHIYNDHIFTAVHFTGSSPDCAVCSKAIKGKVGKQGYQCRGCKMVTHRDCHYQTTAMCSSDEVKHMDIEYVGDTEV